VRQASRSRRFDAGTMADAALLLALLASAVALATWQSDPFSWGSLAGSRWWAAIGIAAGYAAFVGAVALMRHRRQAAALQGVSAVADGAAVDWLVVHASQTGQAEALALQTAHALQAGGKKVALSSLARLSSSDLEVTHHALFVVSTTGEGDAPDAAGAFMSRRGMHGLRLDHLEYGLLALGDRDYAQFCAFGHRFDGWLRQAGARALFDLVEVDDCDPGALRHWQYHLGQILGTAQLDWTAPDYRPWRLAQRAHLNPGSPGAPVFDLQLVPPDDAPMPEWQAGDIAEIGPRNATASVEEWLAAVGADPEAVVSVDGGRTTLAALATRSRLPSPAAVAGMAPPAIASVLEPLPHREYSIASTPAEGHLRLLVRQVHLQDGRLGTGSGWLTRHAATGASVDLRIRRNSSFHPPADDRPMILIGNGTGIAGLRALLSARVAAGHHRNWLLFGERTRAHDYHYQADIEDWQRAGAIERVDLAFSRDQSERRYVQHLLGENAEAVKRWLASGAAVFVCGSLEGMAPAVDAALREIVGAEALAGMAADGRYCRDVY